MRHEVTKRNRCFGWPKHGLTLSIPPRQDLDRVDIRQYARDGLVQFELALFDKLHGCGTHQGLGHGGDPHHRIQGHRCGLTLGSHSKGSLVKCFRGIRHGGSDAGYPAIRDSFVQHAVSLAVELKAQALVGVGGAMWQGHGGGD